MTILTMTKAAHARFDRLCRLVAESTSGRGITLPQLGDCHALARELDESEPDPGTVAALTARLGLDPEALLHEQESTPGNTATCRDSLPDEPAAHTKRTPDTPGAA